MHLMRLNSILFNHVPMLQYSFMSYYILLLNFHNALLFTYTMLTTSDFYWDAFGPVYCYRKVNITDKGNVDLDEL